MKKHLHTYSFDGIETMNCQVWTPESGEKTCLPFCSSTARGSGARTKAFWPFRRSPNISPPDGSFPRW